MSVKIWSTIFFAALVLAACSGSNGGDDAANGDAAGDAAVAGDALPNPADGGPVDTGPMDTGPMDSGPADSSDEDSGSEDQGARDATEQMDASETSCAVLVTDTNILNFTAGVPQAVLRMSNPSACPLIISSFQIIGFQGDPASPSIDDFSTDLAPTEIAPSGFLEKTITYANNDISADDLAELHVYSNAPATLDYAVLLNAEDDPCLPPTPVITVVTMPPFQANSPIQLNGTMSGPGGPMATPATIVGYRWSWLSTPGPQPAITNPTGGQTSFTATMSGTYIIGLHVENSCGRMSATEASSTFVIP
jgi:hypothetical protein